MIKAFLIVLMALFLIPSVFAISVGVSPSVLELGELEKGSSRISRFFIVTSSDEKLIVQLETAKAEADFFYRSDYNKFLINYSEEDPSTWVEFFRNPVELIPSDKMATQAGYIKGWREIEFYVKVPDNSEPGYHAITIIPMPFFSTTYGGGVGIRSIVSIPLLFKVPGAAIREGKILDINTGDYKDSKLEVNVFFKNTGTTTISSQADSIEIYDKYGRQVGSLKSSPALVKLGDTNKFTALWDVRGLEFGEYNASTKVCYRTGCAYKQAMIELYKPKVPLVYPEEKKPFPFWIIVMIIIAIITYIIYRRAQ